jgi:hypothetical protein
MRVEAGAVVDEFDLPGIGQVVARHTRTKTADTVSWACMFTVVASSDSQLAVVHRLSAPTLAEARASVRHAVEFLAGRAATATPARGPSRRPSDPLPVVPAQGSDGDRTGLEQPRGTVPVFRLPTDRSPADQLPAPLS